VSHRADFTEIRYEQRGRWSRIAMARPERLNAMTTRMADELRMAVELAEAEKSAAILLTGEGRAFGAGFDLGAVDTAEPRLGQVLGAHFNPLVAKMRRSPLPIVAAVRGPCVGGSLGLACACDLIVAAPSAFFWLPFAELGLVPDVGNTLFLTRALGRYRMAGMALLAERVTAREGLDWGLVWKVIEEETLDHEAQMIAERLAGLPVEALAAIKNALNTAAEDGLDAQLALEARGQNRLGSTPAFETAVAAFLRRAKSGCKWQC